MYGLFEPLPAEAMTTTPSVDSVFQRRGQVVFDLAVIRAERQVDDVSGVGKIAVAVRIECEIDGQQQRRHRCTT